ncbi:DUF2332 domain-containing protein [Jatrophihabitans telluris]|uniref:DUF2332 domain-containing protein n=1 Tax=Jatrophihabitans telluris TaxID=2038343 RepID=A0ABY4R3B2_9ACTN|nr:DUF2332 domain-containing protein [Jatrophihabitans telluris]UQX89641.1 DUF2332 domain-containing protein [Jatrophihabitans telluris]
MATLAEQFRRHAEQMTGLYRVLLLGLAEDWDRSGVTREVCRDWEDAPPSALVQLRLLAGLHRIVLTGRAPDLGRFYPDVGGRDDPGQAWPVAREVIGRHVAELRAALDIAPQTNEPGRAVALLVGLFDALERSGLHRIRLFEPGASAGLNLLVDRFRIEGSDPEAWGYGPLDSPLRLVDAVIGPVRPQAFTIVERAGCDLSPVDALSEQGRLRLVSFVWPDQLDRHARLQAALAIAADTVTEADTISAVHVDRAPAGKWLRQRLGTAPGPQTLTVVWHSVTRGYWPASEVQASSAAIAAAAERMPIAEIAMESSPESPGRTAELTVSIGGPGRSAPEPRRLGAVADHGVPVRLDGTVRS